jgi:hypothetical protein
MAAYHDDPAIIHMPEDAIELWKRPNTGIKYTTINHNLLLRSILKGLIIGGGAALCAFVVLNSATRLPLNDQCGIAIIIGLVIFLLDTAFTTTMATSWYRRGRIYAVRATILHGMGHDNINPDHCGVYGWNDTFEHLYLIKPLPSESTPASP